MATPLTVVIFGASGDLTSRKLIPALFNLARHGRLPAEAKIVGVARTAYSDDAFREELSHKSNPAESLMYLGEKQNEVVQELNAVEQMLKDVIEGVTDALGSLIEKFGSNHFGICSFKMPLGRVDRDGHLLDEDGNIIEHYGVKEILSEEHRKRLKRDFDIAMIYLPYLKMQELRSADKKDIFLVTGVTSSEFNAVLRAHREKEKLSGELEMIGREKEQLMQKLGINTGVQVTSDGNRHVEHVMSTPTASIEDAKAATREF